MSIFIANWKANPENYKEALSFAKDFKKTSFPKAAKVVICPPAFFLQGLHAVLPRVSFGVQDISRYEAGARTGEVTAKMAKTGGAEYVIIGHSERRTLGETNETVGIKIKNALKAGLTPIVCIGESERDMDGLFYNNLRDDLHECLEGVPKNSVKNIILAYEPKWAIGTEGKVIEAEDLSEAVMFLQKVLTDIAGEGAKKTKIIYGGSVDAKNIRTLAIPGVSGFLVGRASLTVKKFADLIKKASEKS